MRELKIPSLQHFVTFCGGTVDEIYNRIRKSENDSILVSYETLRTKWLLDLLQLGLPFEQVYRAADSILKGELNRSSNLSALTALRGYIELNRGYKCVSFERTYFPIGRGLQVPVNPPFLLLSEERQKVLWISFWSQPKLRGFTASLFATILEKAVFTLPDLTEFELDLVDLSRPGKNESRSLHIRGRDKFDLLSDDVLKAEMDKFVEALMRRVAEREAARPAPARREDRGTEGLPLFLDRGI
ncbi:hypothetical protein [Microvirga arsenatis]|uniref:Uncharacterized protein n=1 Tax=Microvirga arsenatis TaxID=2692265 RepID=A0ABW9YZ14_9HYPH|nr:hypothetical protein [Microvirga arsenatis]NBJ09482.1 hypothetical protein [Microvirga arsenatis]NBJ23659.1 hypothetical protein [Microvirga arsenatis]